MPVYTGRSEVRGALGESTADLRALGRMIGDAQLVALSEAVHGGAEPLAFRNRLFQYLVEHRGFTAIAIESGVVEGRTIHDYVRGGRGSLAAAVRNGIGWTFDRLPQNAALVAWLRAYNARRRGEERKISFYGFDVPGSPGEPNAHRGVDTAVVTALDYVRRVDGAAGRTFQARLARFLPYLRFDFDRPTRAAGYDRLSADGRDGLSAAIADLVSLLERKEGPYAAASSAPAYAWAHRAAVGARQVDAWLREIPLNRPASSGARTSAGAGAVGEQARSLAAAGAVRERAQADNVAWIVEREGPAGKILLFAHRYHLSTAPVEATWISRTAQQVTGTYLKRRFGQRLVTIGNLVGRGEVECAGRRCCDGTRQTLGAPPRGSIEAWLAGMDEPAFLLDLRPLPRGVATGLRCARAIGRGTPGLGPDELRAPAAEAFDILLFFASVTLACGAEVG